MKQILLFFILLICSCYLLKGDIRLRESDFSYKFKRLGGGYSTLNEFDGEIILLYFFSSDCIPCIKDIKFFNENKEYLKDQKVIIIGIGMDYNGEITLAPFVRFNNIVFPVMLSDENMIKGQWGFGKINTIPATIMIHKREKRYQIHTGNLNREVISSFK